jgi:hypothetical protein
MPTSDRVRAVSGVLVAGPRFLTAPLYRHRHLRWGATDGEVAAAMPGDELIPTPSFVATRAITIAAPPEHVWPWLVQMGWHRGGWYTPHWVDRLLFPANWPSATQLVPELLRPLQVGDRIPDGPPDTAWFAVERVDPPRLLVLHSTTHLPAGWRARLGAAIDWSWTFALADTGDAATRLLLRVRGSTRPWWLTAIYVAAVVPADYVMASGMLAGIRRRAAPAGPHLGPGRMGRNEGGNQHDGEGESEADRRRRAIPPGSAAGKHQAVLASTRRRRLVRTPQRAHLGGHPGPA